MATFLRSLDRVIGYVISVGKWLALPLVVLLFLQWPLRDVIRGYSREANDLGQIVFAFYVALSVTSATRAGTHLAADMFAARYTVKTQLRLSRLGAALGLLPWTLFIVTAAKSTVVTSLKQLESFQDSGNPGYFLIKTALWIMAIVVMCQSIIDIFRAKSADDS